MLDTLDYHDPRPGPAGRARGVSFEYYLPGRLDGDWRRRPFLQRNASPGVFGLTWDRGVSTTEDTLSDTYTAAAGVALKDKLGGEVRFGGAISYLTSASVAADLDSADAWCRQQLCLYRRWRLVYACLAWLQDSAGKPIKIKAQKARQCRAFFMTALWCGRAVLRLPCDSVICDVSATLSQEPMRYGRGREICLFPAINPAHPKASLRTGAARKDADDGKHAVS